MSKFFESVRKFFSRNKEANAGAANSSGNGHHGKEENHGESPKDVHTVVKAPRQYDEIDIDENGPKFESDQHENNVQAAPKRAPRSYEEVELPAPESGGQIEIR